MKEQYLVLLYTFLRQVSSLISKEETVPSKNLFKISPTSASLEMISPFSIKVILFMLVPLSVRKGFTVFQNN